MSNHSNQIIEDLSQQDGGLTLWQPPQLNNWDRTAIQDGELLQFDRPDPYNWQVQSSNIAVTGPSGNTYVYHFNNNSGCDSRHSQTGSRTDTPSSVVTAGQYNAQGVLNDLLDRDTRAGMLGSVDVTSQYDAQGVLNDLLDRQITYASNDIALDHVVVRVPEDAVDFGMSEQAVREAYRSTYRELQRMKSRYGVQVSQQPLESVGPRSFDRAKVVDLVAGVMKYHSANELEVPTVVGDWNHRYDDRLLAYALVGDSAMEWIVRIDMLHAAQPVQAAARVITTDLTNQALASKLVAMNITGQGIADDADMAAVVESMMGFLFVRLGPAAVRTLMERMGIYKRALGYVPITSWGHRTLSGPVCESILRNLSIPSLYTGSHTNRFVAEKALMVALTPTTSMADLSAEAREYKSSLSGLGLAVLRTVLMAACINDDPQVHTRMVSARDNTLSHAGTASRYERWIESVRDPTLQGGAASEKVKARALRSIVGWLTAHFCPQTVVGSLFNDFRFTGAFTFGENNAKCVTDLCLQCSSAGVDVAEPEDESMIFSLYDD